MIDDLITIPEAAALAGVAPNTIRNWEAAGRLECAGVVGRRIKVFRRADVEAAASFISSPLLDGQRRGAAA